MKKQKQAAQKTPKSTSQKKTKKPKKPPIAPLKRISKTVQLQTEEIPLEDFLRIKDEFIRYKDCKNDLLLRFCGIGNMALTQRWQDVRDLIRKENAQALESGNTGYKTLEQRFGLQNRQVVMAIQDACQCINSMWTNLGNKCKAKLRENHDKLNKEEIAYCTYIFSARSIWAAILNNEEPEWTKKAKGFMEAVMVSQPTRAAGILRLRYLDSLIRRLTRKYKPYPQAHSARCMLLDEVMYSIERIDGKDYLIFMSLIPRKQEKFLLHGSFCYSRTGNIQVIFNDEKHVLEIHKCIKAKARPIDCDTPSEIGIDKGYTTLLSCSSENEYGKDFGKMISAESERINTRNTMRNYFIDRVQDMEGELDAIAHKERLTDEDKKRIQELNKQITNLKENNIGNKKYNRQHHKAEARMESEINHSIREMIKKEKPSEVVLEDLSFVHTSGKYKGKAFNRRMASWQKGVLNDRLEYICSTFDIKTTLVNAAYTSQYCNGCGRHLGERTGDHKEIANCPNCGKFDANINAAKNILARKYDKEIGLYTPYQKVKEILDSRAPKP